MALVIKFSEKWDKLSHIDGFTTIRRYTPEKWEYYHGNIGNVFEVQVNGKRLYDAVLKSAAAMGSHEIDRELLLEDTRLNGESYYGWYSKIRQMDKVILLEFERY